MTTTTAAAGEVMAHLEYLTQVVRPDLDVRFTSVTDQWAQFSVAGPKARDLIDALVNEDVNGETFPFMACGAITVLGVAGRLFRISFSGEHAYEIAVPARYGEALYERLLERAETFGGGPYGMEALNVLRIEKGFITHAEINGTVTAFDLGMQGLVSKKKSCWGKALSERDGLMHDDRMRLVGLKPVGAAQEMSAGAHLFDPDATVERVNDLGYVTSVGFSPTLGHMIGLAMLSGGPDRMGDTIRLVDHTRGIDTLCEVVNPVFFDPEGGRVRG
jgi:sarcosine oxidase subunit alpha